MAYVPQSQDEEERKAASGAGSELGQFGGTQGSVAPTQPKFVNVADYLSKNAEGSANIANAASGKLESQRNEASGAVTESGSKFNTDVNAGKVDLDQSVLDSALSKPEDFVKDPNNTAKFLAMRDAAYKGPSSLQSTDYFAPTQSKVTALGTTASGLGTEEGRNALVSSLSDHPTQGKTSLNQLLLQGNPDAAQKIQDTAGTFKSVEDQWNQLLANAPSTADAARAATDATKATTKQRLGETTTGLKNDLSGKVDKANQERDAFNLNYQNLDQNLNNNPSGLNLTQKQLDDLGISDAEPYLAKLGAFNDQLGHYGGPVSLGNYIQNRGQANTNIPTIGGVASPEDYAREAALQQLSGQDLGLADTPETAYASNGQLQSGAFGKAGSTLHGNELDFLKNVAGNYPAPGADSSEFYAKYYPATQHVDPNDYGAINSSWDKDYYTSPAQGAEAPGGYKIAPPPEGYTGAPQYPSPTSNPDPGLINPQWNPYTGQWEGARLAPPTPPPTTPPDSGGGRHTF